MDIIPNGNYVSKEEAAVLLGTIGRPLSTRRVLELAKEGRLDSARVTDPNNGQTVVRIARASVERYLEAKRNPMPIPEPIEAEAREVRAPQTSRAPISREMYNVLLKLLAGEIPAESAIATPAHLWLTLKEATDYSGLPADVLENSIGKGDIKAMFIGKGRRGGMWRIRKVDLEAFAG